MSSRSLWPMERAHSSRRVSPFEHGQGMAASLGNSVNSNQTTVTTVHRPRGAPEPATTASSRSPAGQGSLHNGEDRRPSNGTVASSPPSASGYSSRHESENVASDEESTSRGRMSTTPEILAARPVSITRPSPVLQIDNSSTADMSKRSSLVETERKQGVTSRSAKRAGLIISPQVLAAGEFTATHRLGSGPIEGDSLNSHPANDDNLNDITAIGITLIDSSGSPAADGSATKAAPARAGYRNSSHSIGGESYTAALKSKILNPALTDFGKVGTAFETPDIAKSTLKFTTFDIPEGPPPSRKVSRAKRVTRSTMDLRSIFLNHGDRDAAKAIARPSSTAPCIHGDLIPIDKEGLKTLEEQLAHIKPPVSTAPSIHYSEVDEEDKPFIPKFATRAPTPSPAALFNDPNADEPAYKSTDNAAESVASKAKPQAGEKRRKTLRRMVHALAQAFGKIKTGCKCLAPRKKA